MRFVVHILLVLVGLSVSPCRSALAQRYLSEFVGTSTIKSSVATTQLASKLEFQELANRRLEGTFSVADRLNLASVLFSVNGTLAASGNCNVQLLKTNTSGGLNLVEIPFDDSSFALIGKINLSYNSASLLSAGKYSGTVAVVRPVADAIPIRASNIGVIAVESQLTRNAAVHGLLLTGQDKSMAVTGSLLGAGLLSGFQLTISSSARWTYLAGQNGSRFLVTRASARMNSSNELNGFLGEYGLYDAAGKVLDFGTIAGD